VRLLANIPYVRGLRPDFESPYFYLQSDISNDNLRLFFDVSSSLFPVPYQHFKASVGCLFSLRAEKTGGEFTQRAVVLYAFAAKSLFGTGKCTVAFGNVFILLTIHFKPPVKNNAFS